MRLAWLSLLIFTPAMSADWSFSASLGSVWNAPSDVRIHQQGYPDIVMHNAEVISKPFEVPTYWSGKLARWDSPDHAFEIELTHHKLYIDKLPPEVQHFEVTHGFNLLTLNSVHGMGNNWFIRGGLGRVIAHPDTIIRSDIQYNSGKGYLPCCEGYENAGWVVQATVEKQWPLSSHWKVNMEAKLTHAEAKVSVADGWAQIYNTAVHGLVGVGYWF